MSSGSSCVFQVYSMTSPKSGKHACNLNVLRVDVIKNGTIGVQKRWDIYIYKIQLDDYICFTAVSQELKKKITL